MRCYFKFSVLAVFGMFLILGCGRKPKPVSSLAPLSVPAPSASANPGKFPDSATGSPQKVISTIAIGNSAPEIILPEPILRMIQNTPRCEPAQSGSVTVGFNNYYGISTTASVPFPKNCMNPIILTHSETDQVACGSYTKKNRPGGAEYIPNNAAGACLNHPWKTQAQVTPYFSYGSSDRLHVFMVPEDAVWVGAASPAYGIQYSITCNPTGVSQCADVKSIQSSANVKVSFKGIAQVGFFNGTTESTSTTIPVPVGCLSPKIATQSYASEISVDGNNSHIIDIETGKLVTKRLNVKVVRSAQASFTLSLTIENFLDTGTGVHVEVGAVSPSFPIAYEISCE